MSHPDTVIPISAALEAIGIKSKDPGAWRRYWTKLGAPIVAGSWVGSRERYGADPEALREFVQKRNEQVAEEARSRIIVPPTPGARKREGFRYSLEERREMYKRCHPMLYTMTGENDVSECQMCSAEIPDLEIGWHALRTLFQPPTDWVDFGRSSDAIVLLCERCVPFWDNLRREAFERAAAHFRLVRTARELSSPRGASRPLLAQHRREVLATPQPTSEDIICEAHNIETTWTRPLCAAAFVSPSSDQKRAEYDHEQAQWKRLSLPRTARGGHLLNFDVLEWFRAIIEGTHPSVVRMKEKQPSETAEPGLRLELTRGRPPVFKSGGWYRQEPTTYAYDGERRW